MDASSLLWTQPEWISGAQQWIEQALRQAGERVSGPIEQPHIRPWATVMRVPTNGGICFFKAAMPELAFEPALTLALAATSPNCMPVVLAADTARGWMLTRDAGTSLRGILKEPDDLRMLDPVLPLLAELQMAWANREDELLAMGVPDHRLATLPQRFERLAANRDVLMVGQPDGLNEAQYERLLAARARYAGICARLGGYGIPQSIHYDDMHSSNVFLRAGENGTRRVTFSDWGDSSVGHPFFSMLIFLRSMADLMNLPDEAAETPEGLPPMLKRLRDSYLEPWQRYETQHKLVEIFNLAWRAGMVSRALAWDAGIRALDEAYRKDLRYTVPAWLGEFLLTL